MKDKKESKDIKKTAAYQKAKKQKLAKMRDEHEKTQAKYKVLVGVSLFLLLAFVITVYCIEVANA